MAPKINDIVEKTGVSVSTVSRILNGEKKYKFAKDTVEKVRKAADELGYRPNYFARSLKEGRTNCIGLLGNMGNANFVSPYLTGIIASIESAMIGNGHGYSLLVFGGNNSRGVEETRDLIRKGLVDGLIFSMVSSYLPDFEKEFLPILKENDIPSVVIHSVNEELPYNNVGVNMEQCGYLAAKYLLDKGHTRVAFYNHEERTVLFNCMEQGIARACSERSAHWERITPTADGKFFGRSFGTFLDIDTFPEALIMPTDRTCLACVQAACRRKVSIPGQCDVIRISDAPTIIETLPGIPYVLHPVKAKSETALHMLLEIIEGKREKGKVWQEVLEPRLVEN